MRNLSEKEWLELAVQVSATIDTRVHAIKALGDAGSDTAVPVLLELGARVSEPVEVLVASGHTLASLAAKGIEVTEFDMRDLRVECYDAFCSHGA